MKTVNADLAKAIIDHKAAEDSLKAARDSLDTAQSEKSAADLAISESLKAHQSLSEELERLKASQLVALEPLLSAQSAILAYKSFIASLKPKLQQHLATLDSLCHILSLGDSNYLEAKADSPTGQCLEPGQPTNLRLRVGNPPDSRHQLIPENSMEETIDLVEQLPNVSLKISNLATKLKASIPIYKSNEGKLDGKQKYRNLVDFTKYEEIINYIQNWDEKLEGYSKSYSSCENQPSTAEIDLETDLFTEIDDNKVLVLDTSNILEQIQQEFKRATDTVLVNSQTIFKKLMYYLLKHTILRILKSTVANIDKYESDIRHYRIPQQPGMSQKKIDTILEYYEEAIMTAIEFLSSLKADIDSQFESYCDFSEAEESSLKATIHRTFSKETRKLTK